MHHAPLDRLKKVRLRLRIWPLGPYHRIDILRAEEFVRMLEEDEHVHVRETAFLKLDGIDEGRALPEYAILIDFGED